MVRFSLILLASCLADASIIVAPNANTSANGSTATFLLFGNGSQVNTVQWQLAASDLTAMIGGDVTGIGFRLPGGASSIAAGTTIGSWDLELSPAVNSIGSLSTTIASNIGSGGVTVFNNSLTLGALTGGAGPNPFFVINFTTPYLYTGGDLVMTLVVSNTSDFGVDANPTDSHGDTSVIFGSAAGQTELFNYPITEFQFQASAAIPEPASVLLIGAGLAAFAYLGGRRRRAAQR